MTPTRANRQHSTALGIPIDEYMAHLAAGRRWCRKCKKFQPLHDFTGTRSQCKVAQRIEAERGKRRKIEPVPVPTIRSAPQTVFSMARTCGSYDRLPGRGYAERMRNSIAHEKRPL